MREYEVKVDEEEARIITLLLSSHSEKYELLLDAMKSYPYNTEEERMRLDDHFHGTDIVENIECFKGYIEDLQYLIEKFDPDLLGF